ncbi:MAG TPA: hypothetical protein ENI23_00725, partial [bacterium]|nr:hypothetical protein [bacterium]
MGIKQIFWNGKRKYLLIPIFLIFLLGVFILINQVTDNPQDVGLIRENVINNGNDYYSLSKPLELEGTVNRWPGKIDFNRDGRMDIIATGESFNGKSKIRILENVGDGTLIDATEKYIVGELPD